MPMAFVLINADLGAEEQLVKDLKGTENVKEVYVVYGVYDIVAKIEGETGVRETVTLCSALARYAFNVRIHAAQAYRQGSRRPTKINHC